MFNGFSAIEMLIKIASAKLPAFSKLADDAQKEFTALKSRPTQPTPDAWESADLEGESTPEVLSTSQSLSTPSQRR